jgi:hypothetical protein
VRSGVGPTPWNRFVIRFYLPTATAPQPMLPLLNSPEDDIVTLSDDGSRTTKPKATVAVSLDGDALPGRSDNARVSITHIQPLDHQPASRHCQELKHELVRYGADVDARAGAFDVSGTRVSVPLVVDNCEQDAAILVRQLRRYLVWLSISLRLRDGQQWVPINLDNAMNIHAFLAANPECDIC